jgi:radical SAM protein with 4Fe4S-binding SPASM domain
MPVVTSGGDLFACVFFQHRLDRMRVGNVFERPFREVWGSDRHREVIAGLRPAECARFDCPMVPAMDLVEKGIHENGLHVKFV